LCCYVVAGHLYRQSLQTDRRKGGNVDAAEKSAATILMYKMMQLSFLPHQQFVMNKHDTIVLFVEMLLCVVVV
jgi:hypothetical protein